MVGWHAVQGHERTVVVVGGGLSGASFAVQLSRASRQCLRIVIIEPRPEIGKGLAYSTLDPEHRLNVALDSHIVDPSRLMELREWCDSQGIVQADPGARLPSGYIFIRRRDFGRYVSELVRRNALNPDTGTTIAHWQDSAVAMDLLETGGACVHTATGKRIEAYLVVVATGNPLPRLQRPFGAEHLHHPRIVANPLQAGALDAVPPDARVLVVGTGLTALDVLSTFVRRGHRGHILAVSRRGLRPRPQPPAMLGNVPPPPRPGALTPLEQVLAPTPGFIKALGESYGVADLYHALRRQIREDEAQGRTWHAAFDVFRDAVWRIWARLPVTERRKFVRKLRPWYDVHRFRSPPRNDQMVAQAQQQGLITFARARLEHVSSGVEESGVRVCLVAEGLRQEHAFDAVVNCTGLDSSRYDEDNPFLRSAMACGVLVPDPTGLGFQVDADCRAIDAQGLPSPGIRVVGPPTLGAHGDAQGVRYIAVQIYRMLPSVLSHLESTEEEAKC